MSLSTPHCLAEHPTSRLVKWYENACQRINKRIKQEEDAIRALRLTQKRPTWSRKLKNPDAPKRKPKGAAYSPELVAQVEGLMQDKLSLAKIALAIGYSTTTARAIVRYIIAKKSPPEGQALGGQD